MHAPPPIVRTQRVMPEKESFAPMLVLKLIKLKKQIQSWGWFLLGMCWIRWHEPDREDVCSVCHFGCFDVMRGSHFQCTATGPYFNGRHVVAWRMGVQTCPRCGYKWQVADAAPTYLIVPNDKPAVERQRLGA